ncbi:MAG TPA: RNA polymerase sigma factor SigJ [Candidatus Sulfotelmatobacter sp.]|nr:RNA polymerase sigma factor SigJ [Candidatus Sulfotelmatobacter sp.]
MSADAASRFEPHRTSLLRHAYRMLGERAEAEDAVQESYLRWDDALRRAPVHDDRAFLRATVTRLCINRLRSARARREVYVGPWLPEPVLDDPAADPATAATIADDVSFALLLALERLSPLERAAFLLHDALDVPFAEIATILERSEPAVRQLAARGREHVRSSRPRAIVPREEAVRVRDAFVAALRAGDLGGIQALLTQDVRLISDGGGKASAARNVLTGQDRVGRFLQGVARKFPPTLLGRRATINGLLGFVAVEHDGTVTQTLALELDGTRIAAIYTTRNPDKLHGVERALDRGADVGTSTTGR